MEQNQTNQKEEYTIDLMHIWKALLKRWWVIAIACILAATAAFSFAAFFVTPKYSSYVELYVNTKDQDKPSSNISQSDLNTAKSLVETYGVILKSRTTLEMVIKQTGVDYNYEELSNMITSKPANNTEVMHISVISNDPKEAAEIANCIAEVLPKRISEIIEGSSVRIVDDAIPDFDKVSPSISKYTIIGFMIGFLISAGALVIAAVVDDTIHDEEYIIQNYNCPILAKIPNLLEQNTKRYAYYKKSGSKSQANK